MLCGSDALWAGRRGIRRKSQSGEEAVERGQTEENHQQLPVRVKNVKICEKINLADVYNHRSGVLY